MFASTCAVIKHRAKGSKKKSISYFSDFLLGVERIFESMEGKKIIAISGKRVSDTLPRSTALDASKKLWWEVKKEETKFSFLLAFLLFRFNLIGKEKLFELSTIFPLDFVISICKFSSMENWDLKGFLFFSESIKMCLRYFLLVLMGKLGLICLVGWLWWKLKVSKLSDVFLFSRLILIESMKGIEKVAFYQLTPKQTSCFHPVLSSRVVFLPRSIYWRRKSNYKALKSISKERETQMTNTFSHQQFRKVQF